MFSNILNFIFIGEIFFILNFLFYLMLILLRQIVLSYIVNINLIIKKNEFVLLNFFYFFVFNLIMLVFYIFFIFNNEFFSFFSTIYISNFINLIKIFIIFFTFLVLVISLDYIKLDLKFKGFEFYIILFLSIIGSIFLITSNDFLTFYLSLELQSLAFYVLTSFKQISIFSVEAGLKYFVLGSFSSGIFVFGASTFYGILGLYNFSDICFFFKYNINFLIYNNILILSLILLIITILFKISAAPFHIWTPDIYEGAPTLITFFFSIIPKIAFLGFIIRFITQIFEFYLENVIFLLILSSSIASLILGSLAALLQKKIKRLLAYSSISNVGFLLMGPASNTLEGITASLIFFLFYSFITTIFFFILINVRYLHNKLKFKNVSELFGLVNTNFIISIFLLLNLFSLIGIPPLAGFFGKFYLFFSVFASNLESLFIASIYGSMISAVVYLRLIRLFFFNKSIYFFSYFFDYYKFFFILIIFTILNFFFFISPSNLFLFLYNISISII